MGGLNLQGGYGAGAGADALKDLIKQKFMEQIESRRAQEAQQQFGQTQQRIDQDTAQMGQAQSRWDTDRNDQIEAVRVKGAAQAAAQAEQAKALQAFLGRNPHMQNTADADALGLKFTESPEQQALQAAAADAAGLKRKQAETDITTGGQLKVAGAQHANAVRLARMRNEGGAAGPDGVSQKPMGPVAQAKVADIDTSLHTLGKLEAMAPKMAAQLGPIAGRAATASQSFPGAKADPAFASFTAETAALKNATIKAITGAGLGEAEAVRIMKQIPDVTDKPEVWAAKAKATRDNAQFMRQRTMELAGGGGAPAPQAGGPVGTGGGAPAQEYDYVPGKGLVPRK